MPSLNRAGWSWIAAVTGLLLGLVAGLASDSVATGFEVGVLAVTALILWWYTYETHLLRQAAERQTSATLDSVREQQAALAASYRPVLLADLSYHGIGLRNIGSGPAIDVTGSWQGPCSHVQVQRIAVIPAGGIDEARLSGGTPDWSADIMIKDAESFARTASVNPTYPRLVIRYRDLAGGEHQTDSEYRAIGQGRIVALHQPSGTAFFAAK
ncbi:MAG: hypothetical protein SFU84_03245 [Gemmatimonadales bacterium]|nr:hypothetical protein [Gemmatimonadales bacterium]